MAEDIQVQKFTTRPFNSSVYDDVTVS